MVVANLVEIFSSVQGEGPHVGASTLFVRFGECDLRCRWCDSPHTWKPSARCRIEDPERGERELDEPGADRGDHRGGRGARSSPPPLREPDRRRAAAPARRGARDRSRAPCGKFRAASRRRAKTGSGAADPARDARARHRRARARDRCDRRRLDGLEARERGARAPTHRAVRRAKSSTQQHARFLRVARTAGEVYVKVVVTPATRDDELDAARPPRRGDRSGRDRGDPAGHAARAGQGEPGARAAARLAGPARADAARRARDPADAPGLGVR